MSFGFFLLSFIFLFSSPICAKIFNVYSGGSIQDAIDTAKNGDTIKIYYGKYYSPFFLRGKNLQFMGVPKETETTIKYPKIHGKGEDRHFYIDNVGDHAINSTETVFQYLKFIKGEAKKTSIAGKVGGSFHIRNGAQISIIDCEFVKNGAKSGGAVAVVEAGSFARIENCSFSKNWAKREGAAFYIYEGTGEIYNSQINDNYLKEKKKSTSKSDGVGVFCAGETGFVIVNGCTLDSNIGHSWGSAILVTGGLGAMIEDNTITGNVTEKHGAIVVAHNDHISGTYTLIQNNIIDGNVCGEIAPGIYLENAVNVQIISNQITNNFLTEIAEYSESRNAGAFYAYNSNGTFINNLVKGNHAEVIGAIDIETNSTFTIENNTFESNYAEISWPVIVVRESTVNLNYNIIDNNYLSESGNKEHLASIFILDSGLTANSNLIKNNDGVLYISNSTVDFINNTVVNNISQRRNVHTLNAFQSGVKVLNNIFYQNQGVALYYYDSDFSVLSNNFYSVSQISIDAMDVNDLNQYSYASGNVDFSPRFTDEASENFELSSSSYLVDAGRESKELSSRDLKGNSRINGSQVDLGAYELVLS